MQAIEQMVFVYKPHHRFLNSNIENDFVCQNIGFGWSMSYSQKKKNKTKRKQVHFLRTNREYQAIILKHCT